MINEKIAIVVVAATALMSSNVFAGPSNGAYGGIQLGNVDDGSGDNSVLTSVGRLGKNINKNFSFEGRLGFSTDTSKTYPYPNWDKSLEMDKLFGVYGVGHSKISESISAYGLIGYTRVDATVSVYGSGTKSVDDYDLSFGLGIDMAVGHYWSLNIEYIQYLSNSEFDINATAIGVTYYF